MLEVYAFDLMAQVEAMLRHIREYQQGLQRLRGTLPPSRTQGPLAAMRKHLRELREQLTHFDASLTDMEGVTGQTLGATVEENPESRKGGSRPDTGGSGTSS
jgi:hypothetical protein